MTSLRGRAMALFGAPRQLEDAARQAVNAAIEIRNHVERFTRERALPVELTTRIGVNTGRVFAGGVGGELRRDYTVMGKTVNLASRLGAVEGYVFHQFLHPERRKYAFALGKYLFGNTGINEFFLQFPALF